MIKKYAKMALSGEVNVMLMWLLVGCWYQKDDSVSGLLTALRLDTIDVYWRLIIVLMFSLLTQAVNGILVKEKWDHLLK